MVFLAWIFPCKIYYWPSQLCFFFFSFKSSNQQQHCSSILMNWPPFSSWYPFMNNNNSNSVCTMFFFLISFNAWFFQNGQVKRVKILLYTNCKQTNLLLWLQRRAAQKGWRKQFCFFVLFARNANGNCTSNIKIVKTFYCFICAMLCVCFFLFRFYFNSFLSSARFFFCLFRMWVCSIANDYFKLMASLIHSFNHFKYQIEKEKERKTTATCENICIKCA